MRLLFIFFLCLNAHANEFLEFGDKDFASTKTEQSKWTFRSGFQFIQFPLDLPEFTGQHDKTRSDDLADVYGVALGIGREFYWGAGLSSTLLIGGNYFKSISREVGIAAEDVDVDVSNTRIDALIYSYEASLSLNYLIDNKTIDLQPFVEFGVGAGTASIEKEYTRKELPGETNGTEDYDVSSDEEFLYSKASVGMNIISFKGLVSYLKVSALSITKNKREIKGSSKLYGSATTVDQSSKDDQLEEGPETVYTASIGMGYLF